MWLRLYIPEASQLWLTTRTCKRMLSSLSLCNVFKCTCDELLAQTALIHLSCVHKLHPNVRRRGAKQAVKEHMYMYMQLHALMMFACHLIAPPVMLLVQDWAKREALLLRALVSALQRATRRTMNAKILACIYVIYIYMLSS